MDWAGLSTFVSSTGFPIVACVLLGIYHYKYQKDTNTKMEALTKAVDSLTQMIQLLNEHLRSDHCDY